MAAYGGYTYNGSYTTTDQVANGRQKPIMSYNSKGDTDGWCQQDTKSGTVEQLCVYKYTQSSSSVKVVEASRDYGHVEGSLCCLHLRLICYSRHYRSDTACGRGNRIPDVNTTASEERKG
ncbi:hypothetical protein V6N13_131036 [Hibiscus sabdariffa]